jgi:hypothetical protein
MAFLNDLKALIDYYPKSVRAEIRIGVSQISGYPGRERALLLVGEAPPALLLVLHITPIRGVFAQRERHSQHISACG